MTSSPRVDIGAVVRFLRARLDEDEQAARVAAPGPWTTMGQRVLDASPPSNRLGMGMAVGHAAASADYNETADHIARHDPARVLAEVDAKRQALDHYERCARHNKGDDAYVLAEGAVGRQVQYMALPYAEHPDYLPEWRP